MAPRSLIAVSVVIAAQALSGCGMPSMPGKAGVTRNGDSAQASERHVADARLRKVVEDGSLGRNQVFPGGKMAEARQFGPLPSHIGVAPVTSLGVARKPAPVEPEPQAQPLQIAMSSGGIARAQRSD